MARYGPSSTTRTIGGCVVNDVEYLRECLDSIDRMAATCKHDTRVIADSVCGVARALLLIVDRLDAADGLSRLSRDVARDTEAGNAR